MTTLWNQTPLPPSRFNGADMPPHTMARRSDPNASHAAAQEITSNGVRAKQAAAVLEAVKTWPGKTSRELSVLASIDRYVVARRLPELIRTGEVVKCAERMCAEGGRLAGTWKVKQTTKGGQDE